MKINNPILTPQIVYDEYEFNGIRIEICDVVFIKYGWGQNEPLIDFFAKLETPQLYKLYQDLLKLKQHEPKSSK